MKSKNLVSLSVALVFLVLATTGLLIYFAQGTHAVEHIHAWFGIMFVAAAVFHIVNNWASITGYTRERRTGAVRKEFWIPALIATVFAIGIGVDLPVFDKLANAGKTLVRGDKPRQGGPLSQNAVDSIANSIEVTYANAYSKGDTAMLSSVFSGKVSVLSETGELMDGASAKKSLAVQSVKELFQQKVEHAEALDDNVIVVHGTQTKASNGGTSVFTHVLKRQEDKWRIAAAQTTRVAAKQPETTAATY
jgi:hypothetical protein